MALPAPTPTTPEATPPVYRTTLLIDDVAVNAPAPRRFELRRRELVSVAAARYFRPPDDITIAWSNSERPLINHATADYNTYAGHIVIDHDAADGPEIIAEVLGGDVKRQGSGLAEASPADPLVDKAIAIARQAVAALLTVIRRGRDGTLAAKHEAARNAIDDVVAADRIRHTSTKGTNAPT